MMKSSSSSTFMMTPLLFRNLIISILIFAEKSFSNLAHKHKAFELVRCVFVSVFLFSLRLLLSLNPNPSSSTTKNNDTSFFSYDYNYNNNNNIHDYYTKKTKTKTNDDDSAIARALAQLLSLVNDIPVSSRKYQVVRSLAESLVHENHGGGAEAIRRVNRTVLSAAFARTISQLETAATHEQQQGGGGGGGGDGGVDSTHWLSRVFQTFRSGLDVVLASKGVVGVRSSAEKLAAEVLWLAEMMEACGLARDSVRIWASASNLARLSLSAEPRLQASLLKISVLLIKYSKDDMGVSEEVVDDNDIKTKELRRTTQTNMEMQMQMQMLVLWIPLLCRASNGTDVPILSIGERGEIERVLEEIINKFDEEDQERVLSLWLHHFTHCSSSDWPNLHASFARWCNASRESLLASS